MRGMRLMLIGALVGAGVLAGGCGKKEAAATEVPPAATEAAAAAEASMLDLTSDIEARKPAAGAVTEETKEKAEGAPRSDG